MRIKILLFHRVNPASDKLWNPLHPKRFEEIVNYCNKKFYLIPLEGFLLSKQTTKSKKDVSAICFDDGYKDFTEYALPVLQKYQTPSSMYIVTDCAERGLPPWTYILDFLFQHTSQLKNVVFDEFSEKLKKQQWNSADERIEYARQLKPFLKSLGNKSRVEIINAYTKHFSDVEIPTNLMMNWREIRQVKNDGVHIGSHSHTHPLLAKLNTPEEIYSELKTSFDEIEKHTCTQPVTISYPIGSYNETVKRVAKEVGYKIGLAVNQQEYYSDKQDIFEISRIELYDESLLKSQLRMNGTIGWLNKLKGR